MTSVAGAVVIAVVLLAVVVVDVLRIHGRILRRLHERDPIEDPSVSLANREIS